LVFTGKAMLLGRLYGPADLYFASEPWSRVAAGHGIAGVKNPILSDLAFANLPWRAAVREAFVNGRLPLWNRFVLAGNPLLGTAQAGILHPATGLGLWLPVPLSWTFSCTLTLFLGLLSAFLFFYDLGLGERPALVGAVGWGFSTYLVFWNGWSVGPSTATFPLLLLGLRRLAREPGARAIGLTAAALWLSICGGHPESFLHTAAAGSVYFVCELFARRRSAARAIGAALAAGILALLLAGPQIFPLIEAVPHSAEYRGRREALAGGRARQSVPVNEAARRLLPDILPFAHGIFGKSPVQLSRGDGSGMPLGYAGATLFPLALLALTARRGARPERAILLGFFLMGLAFGASFPGLLDLAQRLPGFSLALNYRLVFLAGLGLAGLAALGARELEDGLATRRFALASAGVCLVLLAVWLLSRPTFRARDLPDAFVKRQFLIEVAPIALLLLAALLLRSKESVLVSAALVLLVVERGLEMGGTYPTLPASTLPPSLPTLSSLPFGSEPWRIVAAGSILRPNGATLYGLEDVRGYESIVLDRFADTYPLWSEPQPASFNRVPHLTRPFLDFLNARYAIGRPGDPVPSGWKEQARGPEMAIFENPRALSRAFVPRMLRRRTDPGSRLAEMASACDFSGTAWLSGAGPAEENNADATLSLRAVGPDLVIRAEASGRVYVATSLPDWPGWIAEENGRALPLTTVNHAFVGFWLAAGDHTVRLRYRPSSWTLGLVSFSMGLAAVLIATVLVARRAR
jgi:hypothetical protein